MCPTNLDDSFDIPPPPGYTCKLCGVRGQHYNTLCPLNREKTSLTQQRRNAYAAPSVGSTRETEPPIEADQRPARVRESSAESNRSRAGSNIRPKSDDTAALHAVHDASRSEHREKYRSQRRHRKAQKSFSPRSRGDGYVDQYRLSRSPAQERSWRSSNRERSSHRSSREGRERNIDASRRHGGRQHEMRRSPKESRSKQRSKRSRSRHSRTRDDRSYRDRSMSSVRPQRRHYDIDSRPSDHGRLRYNESDYGGDEEVWFDAPEHPIYQRSSEQPQTPLTGTRMNSMTPCPSEDTAGVDSGSVGESISRASPSAVAEADIFIRNFRNLQDSRNLQNQRNLQGQQSLKNQRNLENQRVLRDQIRNDLIDVACTQGMSTIMEHVCSDEDLYLYRDGNGALCRMVTNPPYSDEVVRLFAHRTNPIIHSKSKRAVASSFLDAPVESKFENCESSRRFQRDFEN